MSKLVTLAELKTRARDAADMQNSGFISDSELTRYLNSSAQYLYDLLIANFGEDYFVNENPYVFTTNNNNDPVALPDDFYKLVGVDVSIGGQFVTAKPFMFNERNKFLDSVGLSNIRYRIVNNQIRFIPNTNGSSKIQVWYIPVFPIMESDGDELEGVNGYEEFIVIDTAIKMLAKEESDVSVLMARKMEIRNNIETIGQNRDIGMPSRVQDVQRQNMSLYEY